MLGVVGSGRAAATGPCSARSRSGELVVAELSVTVPPAPARPPPPSPAYEGSVACRFAQLRADASATSGVRAARCPSCRLILLLHSGFQRPTATDLELAPHLVFGTLKPANRPSEVTRRRKAFDE